MTRDTDTRDEAELGHDQPPPPPPVVDQSAHDIVIEPDEIHEVREVDDPSHTARPVKARPDAAGTPDEPVDPLWPAGDVNRYQDRWQDVQLLFVDDPHGAADAAEELVSEVVDRFSELLATRKRQVDAWSNGGGETTEEMLSAVRQYRGLLDQVFSTG
jgi:hypothetical protein